MNVKETIKNLENLKGDFPLKNIETAISQSSEFIPEFIKILIKANKNEKALLKKTGYFGHIFALYFLAQFRVKEAYPIIIELIQKPDEIIDQLLGDVITEDLNRIIASVATEDIKPILNIIKNPALDEYVRSAGLRSLLVLYNLNQLTRDDVISIFSDLYDSLEREPVYVWDEIIHCSCDMHAAELYDKMEKVFQDDLLNYYSDDLDYVKTTFKKDREAVLKSLNKNIYYNPINDLISDLKDWACFNEKKDSDKTDKKLIKPDRIIETSSFNSTSKKIGRNDPCPCNSGLKYKKCCGKDF